MSGPKFGHKTREEMLRAGVNAVAARRRKQHVPPMDWDRAIEGLKRMLDGLPTHSHTDDRTGPSTATTAPGRGYVSPAPTQTERDSRCQSCGWWTFRTICGPCGYCRIGGGNTQ